MFALTSSNTTQVPNTTRMLEQDADPAIYVFLGFGDLGSQDVGARNKSGQGVLTVALQLAPFDPAGQAR
jgi:hypothetical protein